MKNKAKRWTIIIIGNNRQLGSFVIRKSTIMILLIAVLSVTSAALVAYLLHDKNQAIVMYELSQELENTRHMLAAANNEKSELAAHIEIIEDRLTASADEPIQIADISPPPKTEEPAIDTSDKGKPVPEEVTVDISNFSIRHSDEDSISYSFRVENTDTENAPVSGYTFAILRSDSAPHSSWVINPKTTLINGVPEYFKKGEYFSINNYKTTRGRFKSLSTKNNLDTITILVFSSNGKLILKKDYKL